VLVLGAKEKVKGTGAVFNEYWILITTQKQDKTHP